MNAPPFSVADRWCDGWDESAIREWVENLRRRLGTRSVTLGLVFTTPGFFEHARDLLELIRVHARVPALAGCSSYGLVASGHEFEQGDGFVLALYAMPGSTVHLSPVRHAQDANEVLPRESPASQDVDGWLAFFEPYHADAEAWLGAWESAHPGQPVWGGLAAGQRGTERAQVYCNGEVIDRGGVVLGLSGIRMLGTVAQGCTPVGEAWTITRSEGNVIQQIGNRPAIHVLEETFAALPEALRHRSRGNFFAGLVVDEYREEFGRGDFLVRSLLGADPATGAIAIGALPRTGQTMQFQLRDAEAADEELRMRLGRLRDDVGRARVFGACLCLCGGRGEALFGERDHDAGLLQQILGPVTTAGFFCSGELGPAGGHSHLHSFSASVVLFVAPMHAAETEN